MNWRGQRPTSSGPTQRFQNNCILNESRDACPSSSGAQPEEVRQGHVISKIADAGIRESMAFCIHFLEASSALERQANHFFSLPICSCLVKLLFRLRSPVKARF